MRALVLEGKPRLRRDAPEPRAGSGEVVVAVRRAGICDTDLQLVAGYMAYEGILGHEFVGEVRAPGDPLDGRRVVADINAGCGRCSQCLDSDGHHCPVRTVVGILGRPGVIAERVALPRDLLIQVPGRVSDDRAVFAEPLAAAMHVVDDLGPPEAGPVAVVGDGKLGLLCVMSLRAAGYDVTAVGHHESKLAIASAVGASVALEEELPAESQYVGVIEATGHGSGFARAVQLAAPRGTVVLKSTIAGDVGRELNSVVVRELRVIGSRCGDMTKAVAALADGTIDPSPLIAARYPLDDVEDALVHAGRQGVLKVLVDP